MMKKLLSLMTLVLGVTLGTQAQTPAKTWDFTKTSEADATALAGNENWTYTASGSRFSYKNEIAKDTYVDLGEIGFAGGAGIEVGGNKIGANNVRVDVNKRIQLNASKAQFKLKNLKAGDKLVISCESASKDEARTFTATNATPATIDAPKQGDGASTTEITITADGDLILEQSKGINVYSIALNADGSSEEAKPAITFEAGNAERSVTVGLNAAGTVYLDWGDGNKVQYNAEAAYDGYDNALEFIGQPVGTVKVYGEGIIYFQSFTKYATDATTITDGITSIDLSNAATLTELDIHQNNLKSLDLSKLTALEKLTAGVNDFTTIDVSANTELTKIDLSNSKNNGVLTALDLSKNTKLTNIVLSGNQLTTLDLSNNTLAKTITVLNNQLTSVTFGENTATKHTINLGGNKLTSVDLSKFADASGTYLRVRDNELTEVKVPVTITQLWADGNNFTLAQLYALKSLAKTVTYATLFTKENAQAPLEITSEGGKVDLSEQAKLGETATVFTWKDAEGNALAEGTDYTAENGVFTFLKALTGIHCEMTNAEFPLFTAEKPYKTTAVDVVASGINDIKAEGTKAMIFNLAGQRIDAPQKGINIIGGKKVGLK